ncbi:hypothetical protein AB0A73_08405 [Glycomyces sp. NPDC047369]
MGFWDEVAETASDAWDAARDATEPARDWLEEQGITGGSGETGTITAPPPDGPYDLSSVPRRVELLQELESFAPAVRHGMIREVAKELYPGHSCMDMSREQWDEYLATEGPTVTYGGDGYGSEEIEIYRWYEDLEIVLPTVDGMAYWFAALPPGPDPDSAAPQILSDGESRGRSLMDGLRTSFDSAFRDENLDRMLYTAKNHSAAYDAFDAAVDDLASAVANVQELGQTWEGDDAEQFRTQYGDAIGDAMDAHRAMALNLRDAADSDLGIQTAMHLVVAQALQAGHERLEALSTTSVFDGEGLKVLQTTGFVVGVVGLAYMGTSMGITGLITSAVSATGAEAYINPQTDALPSVAEIREVVETLTSGFSSAAQDAVEHRAACVDALDTRASDHFNRIGEPGMVPGTGYHG